MNPENLKILSKWENMKKIGVYLLQGCFFLPVTTLEAKLNNAKCFNNIYKYINIHIHISKVVVLFYTIA